jgi:hypothetical protein
MTQPTPDPRRTRTAPALEQMDAALGHVGQLLRTGGIAHGAAKGLLYSIVETLGVLVGDPDLPEHARSGYEGLLESARELHAKLENDDR